MEKCFVVHSPSLGDTLCSTPTLRKISKSYGAKFHVATHVPEVFFNNPCVEKIINIDSANKKDYEIFETFRNIGKKDKNGVEKKHNTIDIRQFHAMDLGFSLSPEEMGCEFYPDIYEDLRLPSDYICIHPTQTWESRTWAKEKWQELTNELIRMKICVVLVGKDSQEFGFWDIEKPTFDIKGGARVINLLNKTSLSSTWNVINNASKFITMDSGLLHLAGTTDTHIIQLGSSIDYRLRAPYRKGSQEYKYDYVGGSCDISCASDIKYGIEEWGTIQGIPPLIGCLENKPTFECHPSVSRVKEIITHSFKYISKTGYWTSADHSDIFDKRLCEEIIDFFNKEKVSDVCDLGCGCYGYYTLSMIEKSINCCGFDGNPLTPKNTNGICKVRDLAKDYDDIYDWILCLEVGEHIPSKYEKTFIENLHKNNKKGIILSWAIEGQGGVGHINERNNNYIKNIFSNLGYVNDIQVEERFRKSSEAKWFKNTIMVFRKCKKKKKLLYIAPHLSTGGQPEWLRKAIESVKDDLEVFVVEFSFYADLFIVQRKKIIEMVGEDKFYSLGTVFDRGKTHVDNRWKLMDIINEIQPDIVHINEMPEMFEYEGFPNEILDELYREDRSYQIYETSHCSTYEPDKKKRYIPDGFIHCSPLHFKQYKNFDIPQYLAEYPVEKKERPNRKKVLEELGLDPLKKHVLQVGLFTHLKNQKYTFELASITQNLNIQYHFVGNDCWKEGCDISDEHISLPNCKLWGERNDVDVFMSCMDILIFPSLTELNPIVLKEADSWDMNIFLNDIPAYGETYKGNKNVTFMTLNLEKDKEVLNYCGFYSPSNAWIKYLWREITECKTYERTFKIEEGDIVLDAGANIGIFSISCSQKNINRCYCFEPIKENFKYLQKNINNLVDSEKFELINKAISPNPEIYIPSTADKDTPYAVEEKEDNCLVLPAIKLSDFIEEYKIKKIDFFKMDIEGGEWDIFNDDKEFDIILNKTKKFVAEIHLEVGDHIKIEYALKHFEKFKNSGFEISMVSIDGLDITDKILYNQYLTDRKKKAHDFYQQFIFYAWKK